MHDKPGTSVTGSDLAKQLDRFKHEIIELKQSKSALEIDYENEQKKNKVYEAELNELRRQIQDYKVKEISEGEKMMRLEIVNLNNSLEFRKNENDLLRKENEILSKQLVKYEGYFKDFIQNNVNYTNENENIENNFNEDIIQQGVEHVAYNNEEEENNQNNIQDNNFEENTYVNNNEEEYIVNKGDSQQDELKEPLLEHEYQNNNYNEDDIIKPTHVPDTEEDIDEKINTNLHNNYRPVFEEEEENSTAFGFDATITTTTTLEPPKKVEQKPSPVVNKRPEPVVSKKPEQPVVPHKSAFEDVFQTESNEASDLFSQVYIL
jgi:hypothetical protein